MAVRSLAATAALLAAPLRVYADVNVPWGFNQVLFYDDFSTNNGSLDNSKWQYDLGTQYPGGPENWGTGEIQSYTDSPENIFITRENNLRIVPLNSGAGWTSARIETTADHDFGADVGDKIRVEARIKLGKNSADDQWGIWPAFWSVGSPYRGNYQNWPAVGEVDFFESAHGQARVWQSLHCGYTDAGGPCNEPMGLFKEADDDIYNRDDWNVFSWELNRQRGDDGGFGAEEYMTWFVNDKPVFTLKQSDIGNDDVWGQLAAYRKFLILNVAVGGSFANAKAGFQTPTEKTIGGDGAAMEVDYVGIYKV